MLYWKELTKGIIRSYCPKSNKITSYPVTEAFGFIVNSSKGGLICGCSNKIIKVDLDSKYTERNLGIFPLKGKEDIVKYNDAKCDWQGRLWFETINQLYLNLKI